MTKVGYITELQMRISRLPAKDRAEILADYEEHFAMGRAAGKTDEEISASLGTPKSVAKSILMHTLVTEAETSNSIVDRASVVMRILFMVLILAPFNFLFLIGPALALFITNVVGWALPIAFTGATFGLAGFALHVGLEEVGVLSKLSLASMAVGTVGLCVLAGMIMFLVTRVSLMVLISYFKWNVRFITSKAM